MVSKSSIFLSIGPSNVSLSELSPVQCCVPSWIILPWIVPNNMPSSKPIGRSSGCAIDCPIYAANKHSSYQLPFLSSIRCVIQERPPPIVPSSNRRNCATVPLKYTPNQMRLLRLCCRRWFPRYLQYPHRRSLPALNLARRLVPSLLRQTYKPTMMSTSSVGVPFINAC